MPNQKISELTAIVTVDNSVDVLPIVDTSANTTKKVTPNALKTALALDNVNNTSDANKPVSTAQQDALNAKVTGNTAIVAATKTKITYDAKGLVTAGNVLDAADMPTAIDAAKIGAGAVSSTEFGYLDGVTSAIQTQLDAKQATLVSATNIKTINSTSLLGAGDIAISATPSGVAGAIQFSDGSAFASDAANFFWNNTTKRLGVGTNAPTASSHIKGSGSTSATTSLLVQNSAGSSALSIKDDGYVTAHVGLFSLGALTGVNVAASNILYNAKFWNQADGGTTIGAQAAPAASSILDIRSTTSGVLFPRMTTTQKNVISAVAGLVVYDSTTNKLQCYNGSTWNDLF
jgi:hypothetical protein